MQTKTRAVFIFIPASSQKLHSTQVVIPTQVHPFSRSLCEAQISSHLLGYPVRPFHSLLPLPLPSLLPFTHDLRFK